MLKYHYDNICSMMTYYVSDEESECSDNEEQPSKGEGDINKSSNGLTIDGALSRDGKFYLQKRGCCFSQAS